MINIAKNITIFVACFLFGVIVSNIFIIKLHNSGEGQFACNQVKSSPNNTKEVKSLKKISRLNIPLFPNSQFIRKLNIGIDNRTEKYEYESADSISEITNWYKQNIDNWRIVFENSTDKYNFYMLKQTGEKVIETFVLIVEEFSNYRVISIIIYPSSYISYDCTGTLITKSNPFENVNKNCMSAMEAINAAVKQELKKKPGIKKIEK